MGMSYRRIAALKTADQLRAYLQDLGIDLPFDERLEAGSDSPLAQPYRLSDGFTIGNRFCAQPMEAGMAPRMESRPS